MKENNASILETVKSLDFLFPIDVAGTLNSILFWLRKQEIVNLLIKAISQDTQLKTIILNHIIEIGANRGVEGYIHEDDSLLVVYLFCLTQVSIDDIQLLKPLLENNNALWWSKRYLKTLNVDVKQTSSTLKPSQMMLSNVQGAYSLMPVAKTSGTSSQVPHHKRSDMGQTINTLFHKLGA